MPLSGGVPTELTRLRNRNRGGTSEEFAVGMNRFGAPQRVQQFVQQLGHDMAMLPGVPVCLSVRPTRVSCATQAHS